MASENRSGSRIRLLYLKLLETFSTACFEPIEKWADVIRAANIAAV